MAHFLLIYDRTSGTLLRESSFESGSAARLARFTAEAEFAERDEVEVVTLTAASEADLRTTHARYFLRLDELAARLG